MADTIIDMYCHIFPDRFFREMSKVAPGLEDIGKRLRGITKLFDLDERFREMDQFGDYRQVISLPNPPIEELATPATGLRSRGVGNDAMAELCQRHGDRFPAFVGAVCLTDVAGSIAEARRAVNELGAAGIQIFTNIAGRPLDEPDLRAVLRRHGGARPADLAASGAHGRHAGLCGGAKSRFEMWWCFGWPYETSVSMVRLVFCGLFDRHPNLRFITHHLGGMIPYYDGRVGRGCRCSAHAHRTRTIRRCCRR